MKALITEINQNVSTVLNEHGEFAELFTQDGWQCGMEIEYEFESVKPTAPEQVKKRHSFSPRRIAAIAAVVIACLAISLTIHAFYSNLNTVTTYVEISINPAVRIAMNGNGKVVAVNGINNDGKELISKLRSTDRISDEITQIIYQAVEDGYFSSDNKQVSIVIADDNMVKAEQLEKELLESAVRALERCGVEPVVRTRRATLEEAERLRQTVDNGVNLGMGLGEIYELSQWSTSNDVLSVRGVRYKGDSVVEIEFSSDLLYTGEEKITVTDRDGNELPCRLKSQSDDEWDIEIAALEEGNIYYVKVEAFGANGAPVIFSGAFLARESMKSTALIGGFSSEVQCFENGIKFPYDNKNIYSSEKTVITMKDARGDVFTADEFIMEDHYWLIYTDAVSPGDIFSIQITGITDNKRRDTVIYEICKAIPGSHSAVKVKAAEYDASDSELHVSLDGKIDWSGRPVVMVTDVKGSPYKVISVQWDEDDIKATTDALLKTGKYDFVIKDSGGFSPDITGSFIVK